MTECTRTYSGGCLCGSIRYEIDGPLRDVIGCHCGQCRRTSGHHAAATNGALAGFRLLSEDGLTWFKSSDIAERGFCGRCGSNMFWRRFDGDSISIFAGSLDQPTGLKMTSQICVEEKGDYYEIDPAVRIDPWL